jgi:hypothetical protein
MNLAHRIKRLERYRGPAPCPTCGWGGGGPVRLVINAPEVADGLDLRRAAEHSRVRPEDFCRSCGRQTVFRVPSPMLRGAEW